MRENLAMNAAQPLRQAPDLADRFGAHVVEALIDEVTLAPKPGLVISAAAARITISTGNRCASRRSRCSRPLANWRGRASKLNRCSRCVNASAQSGATAKRGC